MQILVDCDAMPAVIREILYRAGERFKITVTLVANQRLTPVRSRFVKTVVVPAGPDAADDRIIELVAAADLVITADIPLADRVVSKGAFAINPRGELYTEENIKERLATRDLLTELRGDGVITGGPPTFNQKDRRVFADQLDRFLTRHCR
ncbi:MAG: YaiI/YqxD family protein [Desulfurivibrio sp.]